MTAPIGSLVTSLALLLCGGAAVLVALAFIIFRAITGARSAIDPTIWEPQDTDNLRRDPPPRPASPFRIPSTGNSPGENRPGFDDDEPPDRAR